MSDHDRQEQLRVGIDLKREYLPWIIGSVAVTAAAFQVFGVNGVMRIASWVLMLAGFLLLGLAVQRVWRRSPEGHPWSRRVSELDTCAKLRILGVALLVLGIIARFGPRDIGVGLAILGLALFFVGALDLMIGKHRPRSVAGTSRAFRTNHESYGSSESSTEAEDELELTNEYRRLSEDFRERVTETVFQHARRASMLTFVVALTFFAVGIGLFVWLAYAVYHSLSGPTSEDAQRLLSFQAYLLDEIRVSGVQDPLEVLLQLLPPLFIEAARAVPVLGLILIGWIGSRLIVNATRLSQRKIVQETLAELGPLQSTLAGVPPSKPMTRVVEQSLGHTRRSFVVRTWLGVILFLIGIILVVTMVIYGFQTGFQDPLTTATVGGAGIISFIFSWVGSGREETKQAVADITNLELKVAHQAQRADIVDAYVAKLVQKEYGAVSAEQIREVLDFLGDDAESSAGKNEISN